MSRICPWLFGMHDYSPDWVAMVRDAGKQAWCVHTTAIGCDPNDRGGKQYPTDTVNIVRLNNGYGSGGTIPLPHRYGDFARRAANFVAASQNIDFVVIGNEIALRWEAPEGQMITLQNYLDCYRKVYLAIKGVAPQVRIAPQAPAPWNIETPDCPDWIDQLTRMLTGAGEMVDWICLHAYTRGYDQNSFHTGAKMDPPWNKYHSGWEALYDYMKAIPQTHRHLPVLISEMNGDGSWSDHQTGWIQKAYSVIGAWNDNPKNQKILGSCLFRWEKNDQKWDISRHGASVNDWREALKYDQRHNWQYKDPVVVGSGPSTGKTVTVTADNGLNLRSEPSTQASVVTLLPKGTVLDVLTSADVWIEVRFEAHVGFVHREYVA